MFSKEEREQLEAHYKDKDIYDPSKAPEQETADFSPKMCGGGCAGKGYPFGGEVDGDIGVDQGILSMPKGPQAIPGDSAEMLGPAPDTVPTASQAVPQGAGKLAPDQYDALVAALSKKPSLGQRLHWHKQHLKHCGCRKPPEALAKLLKGE